MTLARSEYRLDNGLRLSAGLNISVINKFERTMPDGTLYNYAGTYGPTALSSSAGMPFSSFRRITWPRMG